MQEINFDRGRWAPATRRAYRNSWDRFCAFCATRAADPLPPEAKTVADFLRAEAEEHATSTVSTRLAAIVAVCSLAGKPLRPNETIIRDAWAEIRRAKGTAKKPKAALDDKAIKRIVSHMPAEAIRDRAIILFAYASLMRRSEIAALNRDDIVISETAMIITVRRSKADKTGKGEDVAVRRSGTPYCPVAALEAWLTAASIESGPLFRNRDGTRIIGRTVADVAKRWGAAVGIDATSIGAHSFRRGGITSMFRNGAQIEDIMRVSRHKTVGIAIGYVEAQRAELNPATGKLGI
jgi:integrase